MYDRLTMDGTTLTSPIRRLVPLNRPDIDVIELPGDRASLTLGRSPELVDIAIDDPSVSRRHAELRVIGGQWHVADLGSRHGTFVNDARIGSTPVRLEVGDRLEAGPVALRIDDASSTNREPLHRTVMTVDDHASRGEITSRPITDRGAGLVIRDMWLRELISDVRTADDEESLYQSAARALQGIVASGRCLFVRPDQGFRSIEVLGRWPESRDQDGDIALSRTLLEEASRGSIVMLSRNESFARAQSVVSAGVSEAVCAPLEIDGRRVSYIYFDSASSIRVTGDELAGVVEAVVSIVELILGKLAKRSLDARMEKVERELNNAREAQLRLSPPARGSVGGCRYSLVSHAGFYVAGDLFGIAERPNGAVVAYLGDVTGHGVAPSLLMSATKSHIDALLGSEKPLQGVIEATNTYLAKITADNQFVTMIAVQADLTNSRLTCVDAGHGHVLFETEDDGPATREIEGGLPLGIAGSGTYGSTVLSLDGLRRLVMFSDGIVEQGDDRGRQFGIAPVLECFRQRDSSAAIELIIDRVREHAGSDVFGDDVTVACIDFDSIEDSRNV